MLPMKIWRTSVFICVLWSSISMALSAQNARPTPRPTPAPTATQRSSQPDSLRPGQVRGIQYDASSDSLLHRPVPRISSISIGGDLAGAGLALLSNYGHYQARLSVGLRGRYFPTIEVGWGTSDRDDETTGIHYAASAPFFRLGCDYNLARDLRAPGRILVGLRYGFTSFAYDMSGPALQDPVWGDVVPFSFEEMKGRMHWAELVFGLEAKLWGFVHAGWNARYNIRLSHKADPHGEPWYVPGFGVNDGHAITANFFLSFEW